MQKNRQTLSYTNIKKNPLFENFTQLTQAKKVRFIKQLYKDLEAEISYSRTDSLKILNQILNNIPTIVQDLKSKGFWTLSVSLLEQTYPEVPILSGIPIQHLTLNIPTLTISLIPRGNLPKSALAGYFFHQHTIHIPIDYFEMFQPSRVTTDATKISQLTRVFKHEMMLHILTHELQHARDMGLNPSKYNEHKNYQHTDHMVQETLMYFQQRLASYAHSSSDTIEYMIDNAQLMNVLSDFLELDFANLIHLYKKNQGMAKQYIIKQSVKSSQNMILNSFHNIKGSIEHLYFEPNGKALFSQTSMDDLAKFSEKILDGLLDVISSFPSPPSNTPKLTNDFFIQNAHILQVDKRQTQPFVGGIHRDVLELFYHPEINLSQRIFATLIANLRLEPHHFLPIARIQTTDANNQIKDYFCFDDDQLSMVLLFGEISAYRTQDVDVTIINAVLDAHNDDSRFFYGDTLSALIKTKFNKIRWKNQSTTLSAFLSIFAEKYMQCKFIAIQEIFEEIFHLDFNLVKGTIFDLTPILGIQSYQPLIDGSMHQSLVKQMTRDICLAFVGHSHSSSTQIVPSLNTAPIALFGKFRDFLCLEMFKAVCTDLIGVGLFVNSIGRGYVEAFVDSLFDAVSTDQSIVESEMFIQRLYDKVHSIKQDLIDTLSFEQKFISIPLNIFNATVFDGVTSKTIYNNARVNYLNKEHLQNPKGKKYSGDFAKIAKACINKTTKDIKKNLELLEKYRKTLNKYYDFCVAEYLKIHPKLADAQVYVESCQNMIDTWKQIIQTTYNQDLVQVTDLTDKRVDNLTNALLPLIESFYDLCIGCVLTSPNFNQYIRTDSEDAILNFQKLISTRELIPKRIFVSYFDKLIKFLISIDLTFFGSRNISHTQTDEFDPHEGFDAISENLESLLYVLKFANGLSDHYRLSIIIGLAAYKIAEFELCYFFCTKPTIYK